MRALSLILMLATAVAAHAWPVEMPVLADSVGDVAAANVHWRLRPIGRGEARWGIIWNARDARSYDAAELRLPDARYADAFGRQEVELVCVRVDSGRADVTARHSFTVPSDVRREGLSLRLRLDAGASQAVLETGVAMPLLALPVGLQSGTRLGLYSETPADTLRRSISLTARPAPAYARFATVEQLRARLAESSDPTEAEWTPYDRATDPRRVTAPAGDFRLATLSDGRGGYDIVYLGGATADARWQPLRIKGRLSPTGFIGQYDLYWLDADGMPMGRDCSALMTDAMLLDLRFPLYNSSMRFRRVRTDETINQVLQP